MYTYKFIHLHMHVGRAAPPSARVYETSQGSLFVGQTLDQSQPIHGNLSKSIQFPNQ